MSRASDWRPEIKRTLDSVWPTLSEGSALIEAQIAQESGGDPLAVSPSGAQGLLQLMPATGKEMGLTNPFDPISNLRAGVGYLKRQYDALGGTVTDRAGVRMSWALAAYNGGLGYVHKALALAFADSKRIHGMGSDWQLWSVGSYYLMHRDCFVPRRRPLGLAVKRWPDYAQIVDYVSRIRANQVGILASERNQ